MSRGRIDTGCGGIRWRHARGLFPADFPPGIGDLLADHRIEDAILVGGVAIGKTALDAGMAAIGLTVLPRHHAHEFLAAHFRLEGTADAAIGAGRDHAECSGWPIWITDFSVSVAVGQACTQAPQETHSESMKFSCMPGETRTRSRGPRSSARRCPALPRRRARNANKRCTSTDRR